MAAARHHPQTQDVFIDQAAGETLLRDEHRERARHLPPRPLGEAMPHPTSKTRELEHREFVVRMSETDDRRRQALSWLGDQLRWQRTLDRLRTRAAQR
jgi:hypothetical protein